MYLPDSPKGEALHLFHSDVDEITSIISTVNNLSYNHLIFGGDINSNPSESTPASRSLVSSLIAHGVIHCIPPPNTYTYVDRQGHANCIYR